jgi:stress-induced morphogen
MSDSVKTALMEKLKAEHVEIVDDSWRHAGHQAMAGKPQGEATHLQITVVSPEFEGVSLLARHRMVHQALKEAFATHLHALELKTLSPSEWSNA